MKLQTSTGSSLIFKLIGNQLWEARDNVPAKIGSSVISPAAAHSMGLRYCSAFPEVAHDCLTMSEIEFPL
jgi:hypothetical protein